MTAARLIPGRNLTKRSHSKYRGGYLSWWTPERDAKLRYVMERYNDREKAARVLGVPTQAVNLRLNILRREITA